MIRPGESWGDFVARMQSTQQAIIDAKRAGRYVEPKREPERRADSAPTPTHEEVQAEAFSGPFARLDQRTDARETRTDAQLGSVGRLGHVR